MQRISERGEIDRTVSKANTHVLRHAGKILALEEGSFPYVVDDRPMEFPRVADAVVGRKHRFGYTLRVEPGQSESPGFAGILKSDLATGRSELHDCGPGRSAGEAVFVPARGADPSCDEGYLLTYVHDAATNRSELWVLDASRMTKPPLARVALPQRVPNGFHGSWLPDA